jgi:hypothetical protein
VARLILQEALHGGVERIRGEVVPVAAVIKRREVRLGALDRGGDDVAGPVEARCEVEAGDVVVEGEKLQDVDGRAVGVLPLRAIAAGDELDDPFDHLRDEHIGLGFERCRLGVLAVGGIGSRRASQRPCSVTQAGPPAASAASSAAGRRIGCDEAAPTGMFGSVEAGAVEDEETLPALSIAATA